MPIFERGDIVRAPFPYADRDTIQHRPALIVSRHGLGPRGSLFWVVMITSAENRPCPHDVLVGDDHETIGLPIPSVIRPAKITSVDAARIEAVGRLPAELMMRVASELSLIGMRRGHEASTSFQRRVVTPAVSRKKPKPFHSLTWAVTRLDQTAPRS